MNIPDMEKMIADCEKKKRDNEEIVFGFGVGRMVYIPVLDRMKGIKRKDFNKAIELIHKQKGYIGVNPVDFEKNVLIFDTLNNAKGARNNLKAKGVGVGQVVPLMVEKQFLKGAENES